MSEVVLDRLYHGATDQPGWRRFPGQCDDALNVELDPTVGARARGPIDFIAKIPTATLDPANSRVYADLQDDVIVIEDAAGTLSVHVFDVDGTVYTLTDPAAIGYGYLGSDLAELRFAAKENTLLVLNRTTEVAAEVSAAHSPASSGKKNTYDDLPGAPTDGETWYVKTDWNAFSHGFWKYSAADSRWNRIAADAQPEAKLTASTMPHRVVRDEATGDFVWELIPWTQRLTGDEVTNPVPPFVGSVIQSMAFHLGRLCGCNSQSINASSAAYGGDWWNFFVDNVNAVKDSDRISMDVTRDGGELIDSVSVENSLCLLFRTAQIEFTSFDRPLTNTNGQQRLVAQHRLATISAASAEKTVYALDATGRIVHYVHTGQMTGLVAGQEAVNDHCRLWMSGHSMQTLLHLDRQLLALTTTDMLTYRRLVRGDELMQSAWARMSTYGTIEHVTSHAGKLRFWIDGGDFIYIADYTPDLVLVDQSFDPCLDVRELLTGVYDSATDTTTFTLLTPADLNDSVLVLQAGNIGQEIPAASVASYDATFAGRWDKPVITHVCDGVTETWTYEFDCTDPATHLVLLHNGSPISGYDVTHPDVGQVKIVHTTTGDPLPDGDGLTITRDYDDEHYVGRVRTAELTFRSLSVTQGSELTTLLDLSTFHVDSTDYRIVAEHPGEITDESRWESDSFGAVRLDGELPTATGFYSHMIGGLLGDMRIKFIHETSGQAQWSKLVLDVEIGGM